VLRTPAEIGATAKDGAAASSGRQNKSANGAVSGLKMTATRFTRGAISLSASSHLVPIENSKMVNR
jgi:hypothetical protein